jgi:hypothetical protein
MEHPGEIAHFYDGASALMRELLDGLAAAPERPRPFPEIEDALGWPHRRIASVLGGAREDASRALRRAPSLSLLRAAPIALGALGDVGGLSPGGDDSG